MNQPSIDRINPQTLSPYYQPPAGNTEKYIGVQPVEVSGGTLSSYQALKNYQIRDFGAGLAAAEGILAHVVQNKLQGHWILPQDFWNRTAILPVRCELFSHSSGLTFDVLRPLNVEAIHPEFARSESPLRIKEIETYATQLRGGLSLGFPLYVSGATLAELGGNADPKALYMMDGARRIAASALNQQREITIWLLLLEEEYAGLLDLRAVSSLRQHLSDLSWFHNYQSIPLIGLTGERSLNRFRLMDLTRLRDQVVLDFGCNTGQSCLKAVQAGASQVAGIEGMMDTWKGALEIGRLAGFQNLHYANVDFNAADFDEQINQKCPQPADYSFFFSVYRTKELIQRDRLFQYIIDKTQKGIFFEGHAHPKIDTLEYYDWLFDSFGLSYECLGNSEGELRPLFFLDLAKAKRRTPSKAICDRPTSNSCDSSNPVARLQASPNVRLPATKGNGRSTLAPSPAASSVRQVAHSIENDSPYRVSAIVSTYNSERFIEGRLNDLLAQTLGRQLEIIVVDSASPENEAAVVKRFQQRHSNIRYIRTEQRESVYQAWNRGIRAARGTYVTNANTDDRLRPDALEVLAAELDANPAVGLAYADFFITSQENAAFGNDIRTGYSIKPDYHPNIMLSGCHMGPQPMWRRALHSEIGYFDESFFASGDYEFWCRLALAYPMKHVPQFLGLYLHNAKGVSNSNLQRSLRETQQVQQRYGNLFPAPAANLPTGFYYREPLTHGNFVNIGMITFNRLEFTKQSIDSILQYTNFPYVLTVVDNNSQDGTQAYLKELKRQGVIKNLQLLTENIGVASASNLAWQLESEAAYYLKHDNDIVVQKPNWLADMVTVINAVPELGALGYNFEPVSYPLDTIQGCRIRVKHEANLGGACYLIPKRAEKTLGYWCEDYGLYGEEDHDHSVRLHLAGFLNAYMEDENIGIHLPGGKAGRIDPVSHQTEDSRELQMHFDYRTWKDHLRAQLKSNGGIFERNRAAYKQKARSLYVPRGVFLGRLEPDIQVFDQQDSLLFLTVSGELSQLTTNQVIAWAQTQQLELVQSLVFEQNEKILLQIKKKISLQPEDEQNVLDLCREGEGLLNRNRAEEALQKFNEALRIEPSALGVQYARALCLERLDRHSEAEEALQKELELQPSHVEALKLLDQIRAKDTFSTSNRSLPASQTRAMKKRIKIAVLSYDEIHSNCGRLRLVLPLSRNPEVQLDWAIEIKEKQAHLKPGIVEAADVVVIQRLFPTPGTVPLINQIFDLGKTVVYEADDLLISIPQTNPNHTFAMMCRPSVLEVMSKAAAVTVSTPELRLALARFNSNIYVLPNLLNEELWTQSRSLRDDRIVIGFTGTSTHQEDLRIVEEALFRLSEKHGSRLAFHFMGCMTEKAGRLPNFTFEHFQTSYESFADALQASPIDIAIVPLEDNPFNRCKSNIKWLEYSACGIAGIYSNLPPYSHCIDHGKTGVLVSNTTEAWFQALDNIIQNPEQRRALGLEARKRVLSEYTLATRANLYLETYQRLIKKHQDGQIGSEKSSTSTAVAQDAPPLEIMGVSLKHAACMNSSLVSVIGRVNRYIHDGRNELASKIVKKELGGLPESVEILSKLAEQQVVSSMR